MKKEHLIIEALLFVSPASLPSSKIAEILKVETKDATQIIEEYGQILQGRQTAFQLIKDPDGFRLGTRTEYFAYIEMLVAPRETKLSYQALETLSVITFKQPITKQEIEKVRGINSDGIINMLYSRSLIKVVGVKKIAGNPKLYGISKDFFKYFGIKSVTELKNYLKSIEIDTAKLDALLAEDREEGANILFEDPNQESFDFTDDEIKINENEVGSDGVDADTGENQSESADENDGTDNAGNNENKDGSGDDGDNDRRKTFSSEPEIPGDSGLTTVETEILPPPENDLTVQADEPGTPLPEPEDEAQR
ncbi:MAG: SMC-Scp complex subunit ScpB [Candidatus Wallbacteria bacterium GWC2_49_35]|uniref:SMC-Scp complex subunit ScpB n=1 Tax=Candidatus Wallbacteria bacterium GWC2_49_35 TaxID=1817813 RepID=A0A1F7WLL7_9BACT|nr:MAG: SMC-Scp complex subunit ScpB [Candidatus Wallbacteria bacterium GWC2_49_35]